MFQKKYQENWNSIHFTVKEIYFLSRTGQNEPFQVRTVIPLGKDISKPYFETKPE